MQSAVHSVNAAQALGNIMHLFQPERAWLNWHDVDCRECPHIDAHESSDCMLKCISAVQAVGPTSFSDLESMLGEPSRSSDMTAEARRLLDRKPSLLGRLAGQRNTQALKNLSPGDQQGVLASSFGSRHAGRARAGAQQQTLQTTHLLN